VASRERAKTWEPAGAEPRVPPKGRNEDGLDFPMTWLR
jgi:hypothetical protein